MTDVMSTGPLFNIQICPMRTALLEITTEPSRNGGRLRFNSLAGAAVSAAKRLYTSARRRGPPADRELRMR